MKLSEQTGLSNITIQSLRHVFMRYPSIHKVIIYGSRAKGNFKPSSDIDLTLFTGETDLSFLFKVENEIDELLLPYKVDLSLYSSLDNENLKEHIKRVGIEFYSVDARDLKS